MTNTLYIVQHKPLLDPALLSGYGDRSVTLYSKSVYPDNADETLGSQYNRVWRELLAFNPDQDYLVLIGDLALVAQTAAMLTMILSAEGHSSFNALKFDRQHCGYYPINLKFVR